MNKQKLGIGTKLILILLAVLLVLFIVNQPLHAADTASNIGGFLSDAGDAVGNFLSNITD